MSPQCWKIGHYNGVSNAAQSWNIPYKCLKCPDLDLKWSPVWLDRCMELIRFIAFLANHS